MPERRYRVLVVASHPVQYMAPLFRRMAAHRALDQMAPIYDPRIRMR